MPSEDCNFRCRYCYEDFVRGTMVPEVRQGIKNLVRKRIKKLNRLNVSWFGGEPLYGWEALEELAPFFPEIAEAHEVPYSSEMTTNGYLMTPEVADKLLAWHIRSFKITIDGPPDYHDRARPARDGSPTFDRIFANLKAMARREEGFRIVLRVNFDHDNAPGLSELIDILSAEFKDDTRFSLSLRAVGKWGGPNDSNLDVCGGNEAARLQRDILTQARRQGCTSARCATPPAWATRCATPPVPSIS
jgi:uncharacterized protein